MEVQSSGKKGKFAMYLGKFWKLWKKVWVFQDRLIGCRIHIYIFSLFFAKNFHLSIRATRNYIWYGIKAFICCKYFIEFDQREAFFQTLHRKTNTWRLSCFLIIETNFVVDDFWNPKTNWCFQNSLNWTLQHFSTIGLSECKRKNRLQIFNVTFTSLS